MFCFCKRQHLSPSVFALAFRNGFEYRSIYEWRYGTSDASTSRTNLVNCGPVTPELRSDKFVTFGTIWQKMGISYQISQNFLGRRHQSFSVEGHMYGDKLTWGVLQ